MRLVASLSEVNQKDGGMRRGCSLFFKQLCLALALISSLIHQFMLLEEEGLSRYGKFQPNTTRWFTCHQR